MRNLKILALASLVSFSLTSSGPVAAWGDSFSFGDSWNSGRSGSSWNTPNWGTSYNTPSWGPWGGAPRYHPGYYPPPRISPYDRNIMRENRQNMMSDHDDIMDSLADMLYGKFRFDREEAIELARELEASTGPSLLRNFHPGAVATHDSRTAPTMWGNEEAFKSYVDAMKLGAAALAKELEKRPKAEEGALYPSRSKGFNYRRSFGDDAEPISPGIFAKFNELAATCKTCHTYFRIPGW